MKNAAAWPTPQGKVSPSGHAVAFFIFLENEMPDHGPADTTPADSWVYIFSMHLPGKWSVSACGDNWTIPAFFKIGVSADPIARLAQLQTACPGLLLPIAVVRGGRAKERTFHSLLRRHRMRGEWFCLCCGELANILTLLGDEVASGRDSFPGLEWYEPWDYPKLDEVDKRIYSLGECT